jgi:hypothetical protein
MMKNCASVFSDYETFLSTCDNIQLQKLNKLRMCSLTRVTVFYHINVNVCLNCLFILLLLFVKINLTKDCSAVCHTCFVVVKSIVSLSRGILFGHQFPTQMFCSTALIITGELQLACCCGEQLSTLLLANVICM